MTMGIPNPKLTLDYCVKVNFGIIPLSGGICILYEFMNDYGIPEVN